MPDNCREPTARGRCGWPVAAERERLELSAKEDGRPVGRFDGAVGALVTVLAGGDRAGAEVACAGLSAEVRELRGAASVARAGP